MILVTGQTGFVGHALVSSLSERGRPFAGVSRRPPRGESRGRSILVPSIDDRTAWGDHLNGVETVIHCAARVHQMGDSPEVIDPYRLVNTNGTLRLAEAAASAGARRFVFVSSIKVSGDETTEGNPFGPDTPSRPTDGYGRSKAEAEDGLRELSARTGLEVVIVRPPLIYGPGARGNIERLIRLVNRPVPLPFGSIANRRSLVGLHNLVDLLIRCADHPEAGGMTFVAGDDGAVSTPTILRTLAAAAGRRALLVPVPPVALRVGLRSIGRGGIYRRLASNLEVDSSLCRDRLEWRPLDSIETSIRSAVAQRAG